MGQPDTPRETKPAPSNSNSNSTSKLLEPNQAWDAIERAWEERRRLEAQAAAPPLYTQTQISTHPQGFGYANGNGNAQGQIPKPVQTPAPAPVPTPAPVPVDPPASPQDLAAVRELSVRTEALLRRAFPQAPLASGPTGLATLVQLALQSRPELIPLPLVELNQTLQVRDRAFKQLRSSGANDASSVKTSEARDCRVAFAKMLQTLQSASSSDTAKAGGAGQYRVMIQPEPIIPPTATFPTLAPPPQHQPQQPQLAPAVAPPSRSASASVPVSQQTRVDDAFAAAIQQLQTNPIPGLTPSAIEPPILESVQTPTPQPPAPVAPPTPTPAPIPTPTPPAQAPTLMSRTSESVVPQTLKAPTAVAAPTVVAPPTRLETVAIPGSGVSAPSSSGEIPLVMQRPWPKSSAPPLKSEKSRFALVSKLVSWAAMILLCIGAFLGAQWFFDGQGSLESLRQQAKTLSWEIQSVDSGQGFEAKIESTLALLKEAESFFESQKTTEAYHSYQALIDQCQAIKKLDSQRLAALAAKDQMAKQSNAGDEPALRYGQQIFAAGDFETAERVWRREVTPPIQSRPRADTLVVQNDPPAQTKPNNNVLPNPNGNKPVIIDSTPKSSPITSEPAKTVPIVSTPRNTNTSNEPTKLVEANGGGFNVQGSDEPDPPANPKADNPPAATKDATKVAVNSEPNPDFTKKKPDDPDMPKDPALPKSNNVATDLVKKDQTPAPTTKPAIDSEPKTTIASNTNSSETKKSGDPKNTEVKSPPLVAMNTEPKAANPNPATPKPATPAPVPIPAPSPELKKRLDMARASFVQIKQRTTPELADGQGAPLTKRLDELERRTAESAAKADPAVAAEVWDKALAEATSVYKLSALTKAREYVSTNRHANAMDLLADLIKQDAQNPESQVLFKESAAKAPTWWLAKAEKNAAEIKDRVSRAMTKGSLAIIRRRLGSPLAPQAFIEERTNAMAITDPLQSAISLGMIALAQKSSGDVVGANQTFTQALDRIKADYSKVRPADATANCQAWWRYTDLIQIARDLDNSALWTVCIQQSFEVRPTLDQMKRTFPTLEPQDYDQYWVALYNLLYGDLKSASTITEALATRSSLANDPYLRAAVARSSAGIGDLTAYEANLARIRPMLANPLLDPKRKEECQSILAMAHALAGRSDEARALLASIRDADSRSQVGLALLRTEARAYRLDRARAALTDVTAPGDRAKAARILGSAHARQGDFLTALNWAESLPDVDLRAQAYTGIIEPLVTTPTAVPGANPNPNAAPDANAASMIGGGRPEDRAASR